MTDAQPIRRGFVDIDDGHNPSVIHYYACGSGPALILLHPSPMSADMLLHFLPHLAQHVTAIAIDTPGYGYSDGFDARAETLDPYTDALDRFRVAIGVEKVTLYGSATGAQIAIEYAKRYPESCHALVLDNVADFPSDERDSVLAGYFPDLSPDHVGSHVTRTWAIALDQSRFFPWQDNSATARLPVNPVPPAMVQAQVQQFLLAGADYDKAYRAAFINEDAAALMAVKTPTTVLRSEGSIIKRYADRLDAYQWSDTLTMHHYGATTEERYDAVVSTVSQATADLPDCDVQFNQSRGHRHVFALPTGNVFTQVRRHPGPAWLVLHDIGSSSTALQELLLSIAGHGTVLAPDLPGHGTTDPVSTCSDDYISTCTSMLRELATRADYDSFNLLAVGESAALALDLCQAASDLVGQVVLYNPQSDSTTYDVSPCIDGSHLTSLWQAMRNAELYYPSDQRTADCALHGEPNLDTNHLNQKLLDLIRSASTYPDAKRACANFDLRTALQSAAEKVSIVRTRETTSGDRSARTFPVVEGVTDLEGTLTDYLASLAEPPNQVAR